MKILVGVIAALILGLALTGWQLKSSWSAAAEARERLSGVTAALEMSNQQNDALLSRLGAFDDALLRLGQTMQQNQFELTGRLAAIQSIAEEPNDDPKSLACLDMLLPAQLDRGLR